MVKGKEESNKKVFDRALFDKVKKMQAQKNVPSLEVMAERIGFGITTVRKALVAPTWAQYRKNHLAEMRKRAEKRLAARGGNEDEVSTNEEPEIVGQLIETPRDPIVEASRLRTAERKQARNKQLIQWGIATTIILATLVLLLVVVF